MEKKVILYHGTTKSAAEAIIESGFDIEMGGAHTDHDRCTTMGFFLSKTKYSDGAGYYAERAEQDSDDDPAAIVEVVIDETGRWVTDLDGTDTLGVVKKAKAEGYAGVIWPQGSDLDLPGSCIVFDPDRVTSTKII